MIKKIGLLTSGGDAPGMNAAIRAVVRTAIFNGLEVYGIRHGYEGLIQGQVKRMKSHSVANIIQRGGTILKTARSMEFMTKEGRIKAYNTLQDHGIEALVVIGGDGTFRGANIFSDEFDIPIIGIAGTIDNDLYGTDATIGYDTALNTVVEAVDKIRDTASSHNRLFFVEVMGRDAGFIALRSGIACGAEAILIPEVKTLLEDLKKSLESGFKRKKSSSVIIVAEGERPGGAYEIAKQVKEDFSEYSVRVVVLGHIQRGGSPSAADRFLATKLGASAVEALLDGQKNIMVGMKNGKIVHVEFSKTTKHHTTVSPDFFHLLEMMNV